MEYRIRKQPDTFWVIEKQPTLGLWVQEAIAYDEAEARLYVRRLQQQKATQVNQYPEEGGHDD